MKILLVNDDGVYAPGINVLYDHLSQDHEVTVVAPLEERSTTGHTLTLDSPLRVVQVKENFYGCSGYPADCTLISIAHILKNDRPDIVISGINRGANLGQDIYYSGTVAAAREAVFHKVPAIAVSSVVDFINKSDDSFRYDTAAKFINSILGPKLIELLNNSFSVLNVNVPNVDTSELCGVELTKLGLRDYSEEVFEREDFRKRSYYWIGGVYRGHCEQSGSDCSAVDNKKVSLTPLNLLNDVNFDLNPWQNWVKSDF